MISRSLYSKMFFSFLSTSILFGASDDVWAGKTKTSQGEKREREKSPEKAEGDQMEIDGEDQAQPESDNENNEDPNPTPLKQGKDLENDFYDLPDLPDFSDLAYLTLFGPDYIDSLDPAIKDEDFPRKRTDIEHRQDDIGPILHYSKKGKIEVVEVLNPHDHLKPPSFPLLTAEELQDLKDRANANDPKAQLHLIQRAYWGVLRKIWVKENLDVKNWTTLNRAEWNDFYTWFVLDQHVDLLSSNPEIMINLKDRVDQKNPLALVNLGIACSQGIGVEQNKEEALKHWTLAAQLGDVEAIYRLRWNCNPKEDYLLRAADEGHVEAQFLISDLFFKKYNPQMGLKYLTQAAEGGNAKAQETLGTIYSDDDEIDSDDEKAVKYWLLAAVQGEFVSLCALGDAYSLGEGVEKNHAEAVKYWKLAAAQGHTMAHYEIGCAYRDGRGVEQSYQEAVKWGIKRVVNLSVIMN